MATIKYKDSNGNYQPIVSVNIQNEVVQTTGNSTTAVMSQNSVSNELERKADKTDLDDCLKNYIDPTGGHDYVEIGGVKWATMNVGANSITDYGLYFQWGDTQGYTAEQVGSGSEQKYFGWADYKYGDGTSNPRTTGMTKYNASDGKTVLEASDDAATANWGGNWRMPTTEEFQALGDAVNTEWTDNYQGSGIAGRVCTDKTDSSKVLFFPAGGQCLNGSVGDVGRGGRYWSSSLLGSYVMGSIFMTFGSTGMYWRYTNTRQNGFSVRCIYVGPESQHIPVQGVTQAEKDTWNTSSTQQVDWNQTDTTAVDYIKNKPDINLITSRERKTDFDLADLKAAVADQNLEKYGLKPGDQKTINGHTYVIAGLNPMKGTSTPYRVTANHVGLIVIPHTTQAWNASGNTSTGADSRGAGYMNCDLHYYLKNTLLPLVNTDLGAANLIGHSKLLTNAVNTTGINRFGEATGCSSGWTWEADCKICALSEVQVYGGTVWSSSGYDTGEACRQLDVFQAYSHTEIFGGEYPWLRDVVSASVAALTGDGGSAASDAASYALYVAALILFH